METIQRRAGLERRQVVRTQLPQVAIGSDNGAFTSSRNLADVGTHRRTHPPRCELFAIARVGYVANEGSAIRWWSAKESARLSQFHLGRTDAPRREDRPQVGRTRGLRRCRWAEWC